MIFLSLLPPQNNYTIELVCVKSSRIYDLIYFINDLLLNIDGNYQVTTLF